MDETVFRDIWKRYNLRRFMPDLLAEERRRRRRWQALALVLAGVAGAFGMSLAVGKIGRATDRQLRMQSALQLQTQRFTQRSMDELLLELDGRPDEPEAVATAHLIREARRLAAGGM